MKSLHNILIRPVVTEKTTAQKGKVSFIILGTASKGDVRQAVKEFYGTDVEKVNITTLPQKSRMIGRGRMLQKRPNLKKAIVTLKEGAEIDFNAFK